MTVTDKDDCDSYRQLLNQSLQQLESLIYDIEDFTTTPREHSELFHELKFDAVPILRKLKDAKRYVNQSLAHYEQNQSA